MTGADAYRARTRARRRGLLLRAALLDAPRSVAAWREWRPAASLGRLDAEEARLVPLLLRNLPPAELAGDPEADRIRGCARHAWARSQALLRAFGQAREALAAAGIEPLLVRGLALALGVYPDSATRPSTNVDLLVPGDRLAAADAALRAAGWIAPLQLTPEVAAAVPSLALRDRSGLVLRLHRHLLMERPDAALDAAALASAREIAAGEHRALLPDATFQLLHVCARAAVTPRAHRLLWAADAWHLLTAPAAPVDFARVERLAVEHRLVVPVREALRFLDAVLEAPLPAGTMQSLGKAAVNPAEARAHRWTCRLDPALGPLPLLWLSWRALRRQRADPAGGFPRFLRLSLGLAGRRDLLPFLAGAARRRLAPPR